MASVIFGGGVTTMVGSHAGNTFARNKGGAYVKKKSQGTNPKSQRQLDHRTKVGYLSRLYTHTLTDAQRASWRAFAAANSVVNRLGNTSYLSAQQMFAKVNSQLANPFAVFLSTPPASTAVSSITGLTIDALSGGGGHLNLTVATTSASADEHISIFLSPPMNPGRNFISSQLRNPGGHIARDILVNCTSLYNSLYGVLPSGPGGRIFVRVQIANLVTGITSAFTQGTVLWT